jgi:hypothetical protein
MIIPTFNWPIFNWAILTQLAQLDRLSQGRR